MGISVLKQQSDRTGIENPSDVHADPLLNSTLEGTVSEENTGSSTNSPGGKNPNSHSLSNSSDKTAQVVKLDREATQELVDWAGEVEQSSETLFRQAQMLATRLGGHCRPDGSVSFGFWAPELAPGTILLKDVYLEVLTPLEASDFSKQHQTLSFRRDCIQLEQQGEYVWGVVQGLAIGDRHQLGSLYWLRYLSESLDPNEVGLSVRTVIHDVLATSLPFGVFAPAEVYDFERLQSERSDLDYFGPVQRGPGAAVQVQPPSNILQIHIGTASKQGSIAGLTRIYRTIADKVSAGLPLTPSEQNYVGYEAVQLLPVEPTVEYREEGYQFWQPLNDDPTLTKVDVVLRKPDSQNWGYDIVLSGMAATNPALLETQRPDELVDLVETLHTFPSGPIQLIYDIVYGHTDNQAMELLNGRYFKGPNMYGQDVNHQNPTVRAILLEMQRRKVNTGADGIRVDGAQDFKFFNPLSGKVDYDDAYLQAMADLKQEIGGRRRKLFCIFEDGRPWPEEGWEQSSTYLDMIRLIPDCYQWGPLIFAHNTPALTGFWQYKWNRVEEVIYQGSNWITGCGNHDTLRRGTQIDPKGAINWNLGDSLFEVLKTAYDNPATTLLTYGFMPGLPMDFLNATSRSPWGFVRNTDDYYGVKVVSEEGGFLEWQVPPEMYDADEHFQRLKAFGFTDYDELKAFIRALNEAISVMEFDLEGVVRICQDCLAGNVDFSTWEDSEIQNYAPSCAIYARALSQLNKPEKSKGLADLSVERLQCFARAFMEDCYDICNVSLHESALDPTQTAYNLAVRQFRHQHPWISRNLQTKGDVFESVGGEQTTVFCGWRTEPQPSIAPERPLQQVAIVAHMGGEPMEISLKSLLPIELAKWRVAIASPGLELSGNCEAIDRFELQDSQAVLLVPAKQGLEEKAT
ncbi:MAG: glucosylglycerol hydrolase [Synechococcus sp.]